MKKLILLFLLNFIPLMSNEPKFFSQFGQDKFVNETFFKNKKGGVFIDIGAYDGVKFSNTYFFEKYLDWQGICIEPIPSIFAELEKNRNCICINCAVSNIEGISDFVIFEDFQMISGLTDKFDSYHLETFKDFHENRKKNFIKVNCYLLNDFLDKYGIQKIDYLSIDTEGCELEILRSIDFRNYKNILMQIIFLM